MRVGIIGCGLIGKKRTDAVLAAGDEVVFVSDIDSDRANALSAKCEGSHVADDWRAALGRDDVDMIVVATSHNSLAGITQSALQAELHVLVEKPAACNRGELEPVVELAKNSDRFVKVGYNHRFHPGILRAKEIIEQGSLGPLMNVRGRYGHGGRVGYEKEWRCQKELSGGGELIDQGSHLIDLSLWFLGPLSLEYGVARTQFWDTSVDDNCYLALKGENDEMAWLHASWSEWKNTFCLEISGRDGKLQVDGLGGSYGVERLTHYQMLPEMGPPLTTSWEYPFPDASWQLEYKEFVQAINEGRQPIGNIFDAYAVMAIIERVYEGGKT